MKHTKDTFNKLTKNKQDTLISQIWPFNIWPLRTLAMQMAKCGMLDGLIQVRYTWYATLDITYTSI
jgi:hypothetical protein